MRLRIGTALFGLMVVTAACGGEAASSEPEGGGGDGTLTFWTVEDTQDRIEAQQVIVDRFIEETGIEVELVAVAEADLTTQVTAAVAGDTLPDVFGALSLGFTHSLAADGLANAEANAAVVEALGRDTFSESALELATTDDGLAGVPSDSWAQLLVYRRDLFEEAGLEPPTTYETILAAAEELNTDDQAGIVLATGNDLTFVQQTFEYFAVANGCDVIDAEGNVTITSPECVETMEFYTDLVNNGSVTGAQDADTTRAAYFAGEAAMIVWSSFILDELAGCATTHCRPVLSARTTRSSSQRTAVWSPRFKDRAVTSLRSSARWSRSSSAPMHRPTRPSSSSST